VFNMSATSRTPAPDEVPLLDLHALYLHVSTCGYNTDRHLLSHQAASIAARLRGISAVAAVLTAEGSPEDLDLGDWIRHGLIEAIAALADSANSVLARADGCSIGGVA
jgi:hypothetical protein